MPPHGWLKGCEFKNHSTSDGGVSFYTYIKYMCRLRLRRHVRTLGSRSSLEDKVNVQERRLRLQAEIDSFSVLASTFLSVDHDDNDPFDEPYLDGDASDASDNYSIHPDGVYGSTTLPPEKFTINLPSSLGPEWCRRATNKNIVDEEIDLRKGQANDALHQIRIALAQKSFQFRTSIRNADSQQKKTRAWHDLHNLESSVRHHTSIYRDARQALVRLAANSETLRRYQVLRPEHLKVSTAVVDVRIPSRSEATLAWFWNMDVSGDTASDTWMSECMFSFTLPSLQLYTINIVYRVHWLRAKAKRDRAYEQTVLVPSEMDWTVAYFRHRAKVWSARQDSISVNQAGHMAYAAKQLAMWDAFAARAHLEFRLCRANS